MLHVISVIHGHQNPPFPFNTELCRSPIAFAGRAVLTLPQHWENARGQLGSVRNLGAEIRVFPVNWEHKTTGHVQLAKTNLQLVHAEDGFVGLVRLYSLHRGAYPGPGAG